MASDSLVGERDAREKQSRVYSRKSLNKRENLNSFPHHYHHHKHHQSSRQTLATTTDDNTSSRPKGIPVASDDSSNHNLWQQSGALNSREPSNGTGMAGYVKFDNFVKITFDLRNRDEVRALKKKLASELDQVMSLVKRLEATQSQLSKVANRNTMRMSSELGSATNPRSFRGSTVSVNENENNHGVEGELKEKKKAFPKMNKFKKNSDAIVGKEKLTPMGSKKKLKSGETGSRYVSEKDLSRLFKSCGNLLEKLMKHKFGWVFNKPVDVKGLGLHDYYTIIKRPMDLGTVKGRLSKKLYKSPKEFAEDVRLTFSNAMLYNTKGQDVHIMAEQLSKVFEEQWRNIEAECNFGRRLEMGHDSGLPTPTSRAIPVPLAPVRTSTPPTTIHAPAPSSPAYVPFPSPQPIEGRTLERVESMTIPVDPSTKSANLANQVRAAAAKKPKAKDPEKRDMTYEEKQRLSLSLQELPSEKLDNVVQIIKKRNPVLSQQDDEIEVDIDSFDVETLWELHRFVTNYKKSLSKNKRKAEFSPEATAQAEDNIQDTNMEPVISDAPKETEAVENIISTSSPVQGEKQGDNVIGSSSSGGSGSDSGSSSSDSDSGSSSGHGSDADH